MVLLCLRELDLSAPPRHEDVDELVEVREGEEAPNDEVEDHNGRDTQTIEFQNGLSLESNAYTTMAKRVLGAPEEHGADALPRLGAAHRTTFERF